MIRPQRSKELNKFYKYDLKQLDGMLGERDASLIIHMLVKGLNKLVEGKDEQVLRTIEIKINNFFSVKFDCEKEDFVDE